MITAEDEKQRIYALLFSCDISDARMKALEPVIDNVAWMRGKLDETRAAIKNSGVAIQYDNGGGQKGIRENPLFKGYSSLWKSYMSGMDKILAALPPEIAKEETPQDKPATVLEMVRAKHKKDA